MISGKLYKITSSLNKEFSSIRIREINRLYEMVGFISIYLPINILFLKEFIIKNYSYDEYYPGKIYENHSILYNLPIKSTDRFFKLLYKDKIYYLRENKAFKFEELELEI